MTKHQKEMLINEEKLAGPNTRFEFGRYKRSGFTRVTNVVTDLRHALIQDMALEANILEVCIFMPLSMWFINYC